MEPIREVSAIISDLQHRLDPKNRTGLDRFCIPRDKAADGFSVSLQAGRTHYCSPRDDDGPWSAVELGYPNRRLPTLAEYAESGPHTKTVFGYVPISQIAAVIAEHGGLLQREQP